MDCTNNGDTPFIAVGSKRVSLEHRLRFLQQYFRQPQVVGAVAPSSASLAAAVCRPYRMHNNGPASILEVGAGTGAITRYLGGVFGPKDHLDICEIKPEFADILEEHVLSRPEFHQGVSTGRIRLLRMAVQQVNATEKYDYVISGLPLTAFPLGDVQEILSVIRRSLKPGGVFSYYEYVGVRRVTEVFAMGKTRDRVKSVSGYLDENIRRHQYDKQTIFRNLPPAHARHLRFSVAGV